MRKEKLAVFGTLAVLVLVPLLIPWYQFVYRPSLYPKEVKVIDVTGFAGRGTWTMETVSGLNYWWKAFAPATIYLETGDAVVLRFHSADMLHEFYVPGLNIGPVSVEPGHIQEIAFKAEKTGIFQYYCTSLCGGCHFYMRGWIVITKPGETPPTPDPIVCPLCLPDFGVPPKDDPLLLGEYLYQRMACNTCHGIEGRGGIENYNYINKTVPAHNRTATKIFLRDQEDAEAFLELIIQGVDVNALKEPPDIARFQVVLDRFNAAAELINKGKNAAKLDMSGPEPPLQMPAWKDKLSQKDIHAILGYFISLYPWDDEEEQDDEL